MSFPTKVSIFFGPLSAFDEFVGDDESDNLVDIVYERDERTRRHIVEVRGQEPLEEDPPVDRPRRVIAESGDYSSLKEHALTNFVGLVKALNPEQLLLHNPPAFVLQQMERHFETAVTRHRYPSVTRQTLLAFRDDFKAHLVGQARAKDALLAALYPLTTARSKPVVLMFYGPSGVGKTETAQFINGLLGGTLLRKQFSMFHNDKFASYLFGGDHSEASFAHDLLDRESGVILIDEFDKANPVFHSAFYQFFDSGVFEDKNYSVDIGPALVICTSNYGSEEEIQKVLGDALFSRFDAFIEFEALSVVEVLEVIDRLVESRYASLAQTEQAHLDPEVVKTKLRPLAESQSNVRRLGKLTDGVMAYMLVQRLLDEQSVADQTNTSSAPSLP